MGADQLFPAFFQERLVGQYGAPVAARILEGLAVTRRTTLRANALRSSAEEVAAALEQAHLPFQRISWYKDAFALGEACEDAVRGLPAYEEGQLYLQSLSAMVPALVLGDAAGQDVLDMCAAPGGKTTQVTALSGGRAFVTACEMSGPRAERLRFNLNRQGAGNVAVMQADARRLDSFFSFDSILLDAPCSGSGTIRPNDPKMPARFTEALVAKSCKSQRALLDKGLSLLRPGGVLVYATCSVLKEENEKQVQGALKRAARHGSYELLPANIPGFTGDILQSTLEGALTIGPNELFEGFFVARIRRTG